MSLICCVVLSCSPHLTLREILLVPSCVTVAIVLRINKGFDRYGPRSPHLSNLRVYVDRAKQHVSSKKKTK